jgi:hypothetical protein
MNDEDNRAIEKIEKGISKSVVEQLRKAIADHECYRHSLEEKYRLDPPKGLKNSPLLLHNNPALNSNEKREMQARTEAYKNALRDVDKQAEVVARGLGIDPQRKVGDPPLSLPLRAVLNITGNIAPANCNLLSDLELRTRFKQASSQHPSSESTRPRIQPSIS